MKLAKDIGLALAVTGLLFTAFYLLATHPQDRRMGLTSKAAWQRMANPGRLTRAHQSLGHDCAACHTPAKGVDSAKCIVCHANDETVLQRQPTAFHADIGNCATCHREHQGIEARISEMDHAALTRIGLKQLSAAPSTATEKHAVATMLRHWLRDAPDPPDSARANPRLQPEEMLLDCYQCHRNDDRHFDLFGRDCAACHETTRWNIPEYRHPSAASTDCAQCHQAPPSHYMMHFKMISQKVAGEPHARVDQCFVCHQTTSWPDIKKAGWYKHH